MKVKKINDFELIYFLLVISVCSLVLGLCLTKALGFTFGNTNDIKEILLGTNPGILYFFKKNILFFLFISITPFINIFLTGIQFMQVGFMIAQIENMNFISQTTILYRHLIFEVVALFTAFLISFKYVQIIQSILKDQKCDKSRIIKVISLLYIVIIIVTFIGAVLEGTAYA